MTRLIGIALLLHQLFFHSCIADDQATGTATSDPSLEDASGALDADEEKALARLLALDPDPLVSYKVVFLPVASGPPATPE